MKTHSVKLSNDVSSVLCSPSETSKIRFWEVSFHPLSAGQITRSFFSVDIWISGKPVLALVFIPKTIWQLGIIPRKTEWNENSMLNLQAEENKFSESDRLDTSLETGHHPRDRFCPSALLITSPCWKESTNFYVLSMCAILLRKHWKCFIRLWRIESIWLKIFKSYSINSVK